MIIEEKNTVNIKKKMTDIRRTHHNPIINNYYSNCESDDIIWVIYGHRSVVFWDNDNGIKRVYFYSDDESELELMLSKIPNGITLEYLAKGSNPYEDLFLRAGFEPAYQMKRFASGLLTEEEQKKVNEYQKSIYNALYDPSLVRKATLDDCDAIYEKLYEVFDPSESHLCSKEKLCEYIQNGWTSVAYLKGELVGLHIFTAYYGQYYGYQVWNGGGPEVLFNLTQKSSDLFADYIKEQEVKQGKPVHIRPSYAWVNSNNKKAIRNVQAGGMKFDGLLDYGYRKKTLSNQTEISTGVIKNIRIAGIQTVVPSGIEDNNSFSKVLGERRCRRQINLTGIECRHVSDNNQKSSDLAIEAARLLMQKVSWSPEDVDVLIFATQDPSFTLPSTAFYIQKILGIKKECLLFDVNLGCSGNTVGIQVVSALLTQLGKEGKGLILYCDAISRHSKEEMTADRMLFGSAATATALIVDHSAPDIPFFHYSDGSRYDAIIRHKGGDFLMDGEQVFSFGINEVARQILEFKERAILFEDEVDFYSLHQAQKMMLDSIAAACAFPEGKELRSLSEYGNTSGASVFVNLCCHANELQKKDVVRGIVCGFGVGLSSCGLYLTIESKNIFPVDISDAVYDN